MNHTTAKLDTHGFIDSSSFAKDLHSALDEDKKYKETDYMKKRAVKVAKSYDEFKDMVACAHLNTVSRKEVEELSTSKKGWKKSHTGFKGSSLLDEPEVGRTNVSLVTTVLPKTIMEFGRDWRRLDSLDTRVSYMLRLGSSKFKKLSSGADDFELLEDIQASLVQISEEKLANSAISQTWGEIDPGKWLKTMTSIKQYAMLMGCVKQTLKESVEAILAQRESDKAAEKEKGMEKTVVPETVATDTQMESTAGHSVPSTVFELIGANGSSDVSKEALPAVVYEANDELD